jgi:drug/metabolite transporter (DMT)-like permease
MLGVTIIFGLHYSIAKSMMPGLLDPYQLIFIRLLGGTILFWGFQQLFVPEKIDRKDLLMFAVCGLFGLSLNVSLFYIGLNLTTPVDASLIHVSNPILVLVLAGIIIREKITLRKLGGIFLGMIGALILILWGRGLQFGGQTATGNVLVLLNMLFYALYLVMIKPLVGKYHTVTILKWVSLFGFIFVIPFTIKPALSVGFSHLGWYGWASLGYVIVFNTFIAYILINYSLKRLSPTTVSFYTYLQPVLAAVSSVSAGMERITLSKIVAAVLIFTGVYLVSGRRTRSGE